MKKHTNKQSFKVLLVAVGLVGLMSSCGDDKKKDKPPTGAPAASDTDPNSLFGLWTGKKLQKAGNSSQPFLRFGPEQVTAYNACSRDAIRYVLVSTKAKVEVAEGQVKILEATTDTSKSKGVTCEISISASDNTFAIVGSKLNLTSEGTTYSYERASAAEETWIESLEAEK